MDKDDLHRNKIFENQIELGTWLWCQHCERCYQAGEFRLINDKITGDTQMCPYDDCSGDAVFDAKKWADKELPERGMRYSPYPLTECKQEN